MPNPKIFCNVPWSNIHVYWDGSFGLCCLENQKNYDEKLSEHYNLNKMTIVDYFNSEPAKNFRRKILLDNKLPQCSSCYYKEDLEYESKRYRENFKSVIFTEKAFLKSYQQSPWFNKFEESRITGETDLLPIDWHIDLGNECNLACKMCSSKASSKIASQLKKYKNTNNKIHTTWLNDKDAYNNFLYSIDNLKIKRIHFMGGEPLKIKKFYEIIDYLLEKNRTEISISFVTNGTIINLDFIEKLKKFANVDLEVSIDSVTKSNDYIRQGSKIDKMLENINKLISLQDEKLQLVLRTVPQLLSIDSYSKLIEFSFSNNIVIEGNPLYEPNFLQIKVLPLNLRKKYCEEIIKIKNKISNEINFNQISNGRSLGTINQRLVRECDSMIVALNEPEPNNVKMLEIQLVEHLKFWDKIYKLNAFDYYPDYTDWLKSINYA